MLAFGHPRSALPAGFAAPALAAAAREPTHSPGAARRRRRSSPARRARRARRRPARPRPGRGGGARAAAAARRGRRPRGARRPRCLFDAGAGRRDGVREQRARGPRDGRRRGVGGAAPAGAAAAGGAPWLRARLDAYDSAEFLVAADDETAQLSLLFELATTVPRAYFDGRAAEAEDDEKKQRRAAAEALGSDYESASDSDYGMDDASAAADSGSDDDDDADGGSGGDSRRRRRNANKGDGDDSDRVYSDSDSDASRRRSTTKKKPRGKPRKSRRPAKAGRRPAWFRGRAAGRAAAAKRATRRPPPTTTRARAPGGAVEVTCGWGVVSLAELRASSTVTVPLKAGRRGARRSSGRTARRPSSLWRTLTGSAGAPRLTLRVAGGAAAEAAPRGCLVPVPLAPLLARATRTWTRTRGATSRRRRRTSPTPSSPSSAASCRSRGPPRAPRALDRPRRGARAAKPRPARGRGKRSAPGGRLRARPACARLAAAPGGGAVDLDARVVAAARPTPCAAVAPADAVEQAVALLGEVLDDDEGDGRSPRAGQGLFAPFPTPARSRPA